MDFQRDGEPMTATVTLGEHPDDDAAPLLGIRYWSVPSFGSVRAHFGDLRECFEAPGLGRVVHPGLDARAAGGVSYGRVRSWKMPAYDYHCDANGRTVEASHAMTTMLHTWGELCDVAEVEVGDTPADTPLRRVFSAPLVGGRSESAAAGPAAAPNVPCQPNGCPCCN